eukprot:m.72715 g.72715  ORF g.72715 m.72715 type:complete len:920 (+) comp10147_c0_seq1:27-2786(+)
MRPCAVVAVALATVVKPVSVQGWNPAVVTQPILPWVPRSDWINVQGHCGAVGDGKNDDTAALQRCFRNMTSGTAIYFPPGTYRITDTLELGCFNLSAPHCGVVAGRVYGHGAATVLAWDGEVNGTMLWSHGVTMSRYIGLHFDCRGIAATALQHLSETLYETEILHEVHRFSNCLGSAVSVDPPWKGHVTASAEMLFRNILWDSNTVGVRIAAFNDYDNTFDGCLFRNNGIGIDVGSGNSYVRNTRFENSSVYDYNAGWVYWLHSSIHRVVSVGSEAFIRGSGTGLEIMDCHVDSWFGGEPYPANKSNWSHYGPNFNKFGSAIGVSGQVQLHDCTFTNPRCNASMHEHAYKYAQCCGFSADPGEQSMWPIIASNNTIDPGFNVTDYEGAMHWQGPGNNSEPHLVNLSNPASPLYNPGHCPATGITSESNFYKSAWPIPARVFEYSSFIPPPNGSKQPTPDQVTAAVQACISAAATAGNGAIAYFPKGVYPLTETVTLAGRNFYVGGAGYQTQFVWKGPVVNHTAGAARNATAERLAVMWRVAGGSQVTVETLQLWPSNAGDDVTRLLIEGSSGTAGIPSPLESPGLGVETCTDVTILGLELDAYNEAMRVFPSGVKAVELARCDVVDIVHIDGDVHAVGSAGTILIGFHTAGQVVIEPSPPPTLAIVDQRDGGENHDASTGTNSDGAAPFRAWGDPAASGFFGEMMRFTCCTHDFTTRIIGPQTYAVGAYYQESGNNEFYLSGIDSMAGMGGWSNDTPAQQRGRIAIHGIKLFTMQADPHDLFEGWDGDAFFSGGLFSTQTEDCDDGAQCNMTVILNGTGTTNLAYVGAQPWDYPFTFKVSGTHTVTQIGTVVTNASGPTGGRHVTPLQGNQNVPDAVVPGVSAEVIRGGYDLLRRLGRLDLARHYPDLGVRDVCGEPR